MEERYTPAQLKGGLNIFLKTKEKNEVVDDLHGDLIEATMLGVL